MGDDAIRMQVDVDAAPDEVMRALTTADAVERWWSTTVEGSPGDPGGRFTIGLPAVPQPFAFSVRRDGDRSLAWQESTASAPVWACADTLQW